jgi:hypothetical protein
MDDGQPLSGAAPVPGHTGSFRSVASIALGAGPTGVVDAAEPGTYTLCAWLLDVSVGAGDVLAPAASASVTLRAPTGTLAYNVPELVKVGRRFDLVTRYDTSAPNVRMYVDIKRLPASGPACGATHTSDRHAVKLVTIRTPGSKTTSRVRLRADGVYVTCAWLEWSHGAIDGPFAGRLVVTRRHQRPTYWCGRTSQRLRGVQTRHASCTIAFGTIDGQVVDLVYWARFTCRAPGRRASHKVYNTSLPVFGMSSRRSFTGHYRRGSDRASVSATLTGKRGRGVLRESYRSGAYTCASGSVRFTVRRA